MTSDEIGVIETQYGKIKFEFYPDEAPKTVAQIQGLIKKGFYDGLNFHRVEPGFVIQGGDPNGNGTGGSGKTIPAEFKGQTRKHVLGIFSMARSQDPDSADSQFFVCLGDASFLNQNYTIFGNTIEGIDIVQKIRRGDKMTKVYLEPRKK